MRQLTWKDVHEWTKTSIKSNLPYYFVTSEGLIYVYLKFVTDYTGEISISINPKHIADISHGYYGDHALHIGFYVGGAVELSGLEYLAWSPSRDRAVRFILADNVLDSIRKFESTHFSIALAKSTVTRLLSAIDEGAVPQLMII